MLYLRSELSSRSAEKLSLFRTIGKTKAENNSRRIPDRLRLSTVEPISRRPNKRPALSQLIPIGKTTSRDSAFARRLTWLRDCLSPRAFKRSRRKLNQNERKKKENRRRIMTTNRRWQRERPNLSLQHRQYPPPH